MEVVLFFHILLIKGVFICKILEGTPSAKEGLRFGDQILQVDHDELAGLGTEQVSPLVNLL